YLLRPRRFPPPTQTPKRNPQMSALDFLILLLIAAICGAIAQAIAGFSRGGLLVSIAVGFIGAILGLWLQRLTGLPELFTIEVDGHASPIIWSISGGVLFAAVVSLLTMPRRVAYYYPASSSSAHGCSPAPGSLVAGAFVIRRGSAPLNSTPTR